MNWGATTLAFYGTGAAAFAASLAGLKSRLRLSSGKHPSLAGHARLARRMASLVRHYEYDDARFFCADDAPDDITTRRRAAFMRLAESCTDRTKFAKSAELTAAASESISDLQFTAAYRVPFQFSRFVRPDTSRRARSCNRLRA